MLKHFDLDYNTENSYSINCRHREVFGSQYACCPLTKEEIEMEKLQTGVAIETTIGVELEATVGLELEEGIETELQTEEDIDTKIGEEFEGGLLNRGNLILFLNRWRRVF